MILWHYKCNCGYKWTCWWDKYSKDMCVKCNKFVEPEEKLQ